MATTGVGFRWLDLLEKEFDKACVSLDTSLVDLETEEPETVFSARQKIATLSSCFAQLTHKALTIFQHSAKLEAELVDMRAELVQARAASAGGCQESGDMAGNVPEAARARAEAAQLARENASLRETVLTLHSELFGARLATKYLDKELAGRIQQLQLLGSDMRAELRDSLWAQVEAEILLQRHKTLVRVCRGTAPRPARPASPQRARARTVRVRRSPHLGLGISVTGGREHGVPILISELEAGGPAALTGQLYVGDAILAINDVDLTQACHKEAVQALQSVKGDCALCVQYIATDDDDRLSEDNYRFPLYPEDGEDYCEERDGSGATPTAPRTPDYNHRCNSEEHSCSESESRYEVYKRPSPRLPALSAPSALPALPPLPALPAYPDYNNINNNLNILDMDDDSIKIEARLESVQLEAPASPRSTPVHLARSALKKKRRADDWRTKGAYSAVSIDGVSSDEPAGVIVGGASGEGAGPHARDWRTRGTYTAIQPAQSSDDEALDNSPRSDDVCKNKTMLPHIVASLGQETVSTLSVTSSPAAEGTMLPPAISNTLTSVSAATISNSIALPSTNVVSSTSLTSTTPKTLNSVALTTTVPPTLNATSMPNVTLTPTVQTSVNRHSSTVITPSTDVIKKMVNGDTKPKKEIKNFRIGSARRVEARALLNGDGDPDFGTPV